MSEKLTAAKKREVSDAFNKALDMNISWHRLPQKDLEAIARELERPTRLIRILLKMDVKTRAKARAGELAEAGTSLLGQAIEEAMAERPIGRFLHLMSAAESAEGEGE